MKRFIGLGLAYHDSSVAVFNAEGGLLFYSQAERISRKKADAHLGDLNRLFEKAGLAPLSGRDVIYCCGLDHLGKFLRELRLSEARNWNHVPVSELLGDLKIQYISHHLAHAASSFLFRGESVDRALYLAYDGSGTSSNLAWSCFSSGWIGERVLEERKDRVDWDLSPGHRLSRLVLPETSVTDIAGKLMGLSGHVPRERLQYLPMSQVPLSVARMKREGPTREVLLEYASHYHSFIQDAKSVLAQELVGCEDVRNIVVGGGTFLALELNTYLHEQGKNVIFGPPVNDSGLGLGCAALAFFNTNGFFPPPLQTPFLQWCPMKPERNYQSPKKAAERLVDGNQVLGLLAGQGEAGPRALGHRSLLAIPTVENKKRVSESIKGRESYRPLAPIVTDREFDRFFTGPQGRYMQFRNDCNPGAVDVVPGVVHSDLTARVQVIRPDDQPWLYELLLEVGKKTGAECLINTSLNAPGKPICNTLQDAECELDQSRIELICIS